MARISALVKRHRLTAFFILAYALSWWAWILYALGVFPNPVASFGPVVLAAYIAVPVAVLGIHALHNGKPRYGQLGTVGTVMTFIGYAVIAVVTAINMVQGHRSLQTVRISAAVVLLIGSALLGVIIIRARLLPWWCGVLLIVAFPLGDVANAIFSSAEKLLLALLWESSGVALLSRRQEVEPAVTQPAAG